jgi:hypothetical protein
MAMQFDIEKFNKILKEHFQKLQATKITNKEIVFSNGLILTSPRDIRLCKRRVMNGDKVWKDHFDKIYSQDENQRNNVEKNVDR